MRTTLLLGGHLLKEAENGPRERTLDLPEGACVETLIQRLGLTPDRTKLILVNGRGATPSTPLREGDRVALFPPELSFNTFVSLSFRKERVEAREGSKERTDAQD